MRNQNPLDAGMIVLLVATGAAGLAWITVFGAWAPALACAAAIPVGLWAARAINKQ